MNGLIKIAISRFDAEIAKMPARKAVEAIRRVYGDAISGVMGYKQTPEQKKLLALSSIKQNVTPKRFNEYADEMKGLYKKPLRKTLKQKRSEFSYNYHRDKPLSEYDKRDISWMLKGKKARQVLKPLPGDPEEEIYITHGGTMEHLERLTDRNAGGVAMNGVLPEQPSKTAKGIWVHHGTEKGVKTGFGQPDDYYAHRAAGHSGLTPVRIRGKIKRKYVAHTGGDESFIPQEHMHHLRITGIESKPTIFTQHDMDVASEGRKYLERFGV